MKKLNIESNSCILSVNDYEGTTINEKSLGKIVKNALPKGLEQYHKYPVKLNLSIEFLGDDKLKVETEGYEVKEENEAKESEEEN